MDSHPLWCRYCCSYSTICSLKKYSVWGKDSCSKDANEKLNTRKSVGIQEWSLANLFFLSLISQLLFVCTDVQFFKIFRAFPEHYSKLDKFVRATSLSKAFPHQFPFVFNSKYSYLNKYLIWEKIWYINL